MKRFATVCLRCTGLLFLAMLSVGASDVQNRRFDGLVPPSSSHYFSIQNYEGLIRKLESSPYDELLEEPDVRRFLRQLTDEMAEGLSTFREATGASPAEIESVFRGPIALAANHRLGATGRHQEQGGPWVLLLADVGPEARVRELVDRLLWKTAGREDYRVTQERYRKHTVHHIAPRTDNGAGGKNRSGPHAEHGGINAYICLENDFLALASGRDRGALETHLDLRDGIEGPSLRQNPLYRELYNDVGRGADYLVFQDYEPLWASIRQTARWSMLIPFRPAQVMKELGIFDLRGQMTGTRVTSDGVVSRGFVAAPGPRKGILKALATGEKVEVTPPPFVGRDAGVYFGGHFSLPVMWEEILRVIKTLNPTAHQQLRAQIDSDSAPIHIERDLIDAVGNRWYLYLPRDVIENGQPRSVNATLAITVTEPATLRETLDRLARLPRSRRNLKREEYENAVIYKMPPVPIFPGLYGGESASAPIQISLVVLEEHLVICMSPTMARRIVSGHDRPSSPLRALPDFQRAQSHALQSPHALFYLDQRAVGRWGWGVMKTLFNDGELDWPQYQTVEEYLDVSVGTMKWTEEGLRTKFWLGYPSDK